MDMYKKFETEFTKNKFNYSLVKRTNFDKKNVAIYKQTDPETDNVYYEAVVLIPQEEADRVSFGNIIHYEAKENYPSSEQWGVNGFTFRDLDKAEIKFNELIELINKPKI